MEDGQKVRLSVKSGAIIAKPEREDLKHVNRTKSKEAGERDTLPDEVHKKTYTGEDFVKVYHEFQEFIRQKEAKEQMLSFGTGKKWMSWIKFIHKLIFILISFPFLPNIFSMFFSKNKLMNNLIYK